MKFDASIVSLGSWNSRIFTPDWVSNNIFAMPEGESMNISLDENQLSLSYEWKSIHFIMSDDRVVFKTNENSASTLKLMEECYKRLIDLLCYTPISAVGFNLNLILNNDEFLSTKINALIKTQNVGEYVNTSFTFNNFKDKFQRNIVVKINKNGGEIRANFHYPRYVSLPTVGTAFTQIASDLINFLGYEFSFK